MLPLTISFWCLGALLTPVSELPPFAGLNAAVTHSHVFEIAGAARMFSPVCAAQSSSWS
jgi:hypothetical protein